MGCQAVAPFTVFMSTVPKKKSTLTSTPRELFTMGRLGNKRLALFLMFAVSASSGCSDNHISKDNLPVSEQHVVITLDQGWTDDQRSSFYTTSQGSQLIPYSWFMALEQSDNNELFRENKNIKQFGYIPQDLKPGSNPNGLPIGFVKDDNMEDFLTSALSTSRLQSGTTNTSRPYKEWLGLTCAACHTSEIQHNGKTIRIDGGPPLSDFQSFIVELSKSLKATVEDDQKLTRFSRKVFAEGGYNEIEKQRLKSEINGYRSWLDNYITMTYGELSTPYGYGRLDAFGTILNRVTASFTGIEENARPANAPVSYPFLWNTSQLSWVQWNGSVNNHIGRNVGEVSGVFAHTILNTANEGDRFFSSAKIDNLDQLERLMGQLDSPKWNSPGSPLPQLDQTKVSKGKNLYAKNCMRCHSIRDENGQFPMTAPNQVGKQFIKINMIPLDKIETDPLMAMNFINPDLNVKPGIMRNYLPEPLQSQETVPRAVMLSVYVRNVIAKQIAAINSTNREEFLLTLSGGHIPPEKGGPTPPRLDAYKARPLNGIWATAPYLHNGSVSSLYEMLLPADERKKSFYVGNNKFDSEHVGFVSNQDGNNFLFKTVDDKGNPIPGNSNYGHSGKFHTATTGDDGQWRNYTDTERYQLIEYLKTL